MSKTKNLKEKQLNNVSGGGIIRADKSPVLRAFMDNGFDSPIFKAVCRINKLNPDDLGESYFESAILRIDRMWNKGYIDRDDKNFLNSFGINF